MKALLKKYLVYLLSIAIVRLAVPSPAIGQGDMSYGKPTAGEAAAPALPGPSQDVSTRGGIRHAFAFGDTTEYDFPEEEEAKHLWRDVALWVVVAGFVAFFVVKVFLKGDPDEPESEKPGKDIPPTTIIAPQPAAPPPVGP